MARWAVANREVSIRLACVAFTISQSCYRYQPKLSDENAQIADWLLLLTRRNKSWGFGSVLFISAQYQGLWLEPQAGLSDLQGADAEYADQAKAKGLSGKSRRRWLVPLGE